jgi:tRNA(Ile)-lysidine synthase
MESFEDKLLTWICSNGLFDNTERVLLAVSGGADSVAMAAALCRLIECHRLHIEVTIGHINHGLRGAASDEDEAFVFSLGKRLGVPVFSKRVDVRGAAAARRLSIETAGRQLRLQAIMEMALANACNCAATAHHADDQAETLVHRLMRGTALRGLCGIRPQTNFNGLLFVRPLLTVRREEIEAFCRMHDLVWREDASNRLHIFTRNRIRHRLMPQLKEQTADINERLTKLAVLCQQAQQRIEKAAGSVKVENLNEHQIAYSRTQLTSQSPWVQAELINRAVQGIGGGLRDVTSRHYRTLMHDAAGPRCTKKMWPGEIIAAVEPDKVLLQRPATYELSFPSEPIRLEIGTAVSFGPYTIEAKLLDPPAVMSVQTLRNKPALTERVDADCIEGPLAVRALRPGDRFWPIGLGKEKKAARFLIDAKTESREKKKLFVLTDSKKIVWLCPVRLDDRVKITAETKNILEILICLPEERNKQR